MEIYLRQRSGIVCLITIALLLVFFVLGGVVGFVKAKVTPAARPGVSAGCAFMRCVTSC